MKIRSIGGLATVLFAVSVHALTREEQSLDVDRTEEWAAGTTCVVNYSNTCTGWMWLWDGFADHDLLGVISPSCCGGPSNLLQSTLLTFSPAPAGRGFTGTLSIYAADANSCPSGPVIAYRPFLPFSGVQTVNWGGVSVPSPFVMVYEFRVEIGPTHISRFASDHPAAGATGPQACGACFPATRETHSFLYGNLNSPLCPGETFNDGVCDAELIWTMSFACPVGIDPSSWSKVKSLYR